MRDPGLVAVDLVDVALAHRAGLQRSEIGAGVGLGEHRRRQDFAGRDLRQPLGLLLVGAAAEDQLGCDLRARAERAHADIAARKLLGDDAHRLLAEPHPAERLGDGQAEHAQLGHLRNDLERDVAVGAVPAMRVVDDLAVGKLAHHVADRFQRILETADPDRRGVAVADQFDEPRAVFRRIARGDQRVDLRRHPRGSRGGRESQVGEPHDFVLADRNATLDLGEVFTETDANQQFFGLAKLCRLVRPFGIGGQLPHRLHVGCQPGQAVRRSLFTIEQPWREASVHHHALAHLDGGIGEQRFRGLRRGTRRRHKALGWASSLGGLRHDWGPAVGSKSKP